MIQSTAPRHKLEQTLMNTAQAATSPVDEQQRKGYGVIEEVDEGNSRVKVRLFSDSGDFIVNDGAFSAVKNTLQEISHKFGKLRRGLIVMVEWRGKHGTRSPDIWVISDELEEHFKSGRKVPRSNLLATLPHKVISGGMGIG